ncbi:MAG: DUF5752 family protein [Nitrospirota bacterium]
MIHPFRFFYESGITLNAGIKADSLISLYKGVKKVSDSSLFYHLYHSYYRRHFTTFEHMNDFSSWIWENLGQQFISEKIAIINPLLFNSIKDCRDHLLNCLQEYVVSGDMFPRVPKGREFFFLEIKSFVLPTGLEAFDLKEFKKGIDKASLSVLFFHLISSKIRIGHESNDFSEWLNNELQLHDIAAEIETLNIFSSNLWEIKKRIIKIIDKNK